MSIILRILPAMTGHDHDHHHHHHHDHDHSELSETELRVRALETILTEKGYVDPAALDLLIETYEIKVGPRNGARVVARAWVDPAFRARLLDGCYAGDHRNSAMPDARANTSWRVENTPQPAQHGRVHAVLLLSVAGARAAAGLVQIGALSLRGGKRSARRAGGFRLCAARADTEISVWDSTAEIRYLVLPMRPAGTEGWSEERLADLVTRDSMIGTGLPKQPHEVA